MPNVIDFSPEYSTDSIWRGEDMTKCLTDDLNTIEADIDALQVGKADVNHLHAGYATDNHSHGDIYAPVGHIHDGYAPATHAHDEYASSAHVHNEYSPITHEHNSYAALSHIHTGYADAEHTHSEFALASHEHQDYALALDVADLVEMVGDTSVSSQISTAVASKADAVHSHDNYAEIDHTHSIYAEIDHSHNNYAMNNHIHSYNDLDNLPSLPSSLPANGGNSDTVDGKHASDFALASDMSDLQLLVGDTSVAAQISTAIQSIDMSDYATESYVNTQVSALVDSAPGTLNTLNELAAALGDDPNFATTVATQIGGKVDKVDGKGLSTNDYTTAEKNKLAGIADGANKTTVDSALSTTSTNPVQNKIVTAQINNLKTLVGDTAVSTQISDAIADNAYTLPSAGSALGGVKSGGDVTISAGVITVNDDSHNHIISNVDGLQTALDGKAASNHSHSGYAASNHTHSGYAASSHNHSAANITSGTLPIARGGTGATSAAAAVTNLGISDYVVAQGTTGIWTWRKWNSGIAECWGCNTISYKIDCTTQRANAVYTDATFTGSNVSLPSGLFTSVNYANSNVRSNGYSISQVSGLTTTTLTYRMWCPYSTLLNNGTVFEFHVKGRWK